MRAYGDIDYDKRIIRINKVRSKKWAKKHKKAGVLDTIVHEDLHRQHPRMSERVIIKKTKDTIRRMSRMRKRKYYSKFRGG